MQRRTKLAFGILFLFGLMFLLVLVGLYRIATRGSHADVPDNALLVVNLSGTYSDTSPSESFATALFDEKPSTLYSVRSALRRARDDTRIRGMLLNVSGLHVGWGVAQELREAIQEFKSSGKQVTAFMESAEEKDYYVACIADKLYLAPEGMLLLNGLSLDAEFFKDVLTKVGVEADYHHMGEYKSAAETYTRNSMSPAQKEAMNSIIDDLYGQLLEAIAEGRKLSRAEVEAYIDDFDISGARLVEARMIDGLLYHDQVLDTLNVAGAKKLTQIELGDYGKAKSSALELDGENKIAVLYVSGEIRSGESGRGGMFGGESVGSDTIAEAAKAIREDDEIKAVILRIDSPGGSSLASDLMWRELIRIKEKKPVIVSMSDLAASGGYWLATSGDVLIAQPGTITGSIGVFIGKLNLRGLLDKVGVNVETVSRGRYAQMFSPFRSFDDNEVKKIDAMLRETYDSFLNKVAQARKMTQGEVDKVARGRIWTGEQAKERKLVDELGGMTRAIEIAKQKAGIAESAEVSLVMYPKEDSLLSRILSQLGVSTQLELGAETRKILSLLSQEPNVEMDPGPQALLPFIPVIH